MNKYQLEKELRVLRFLQNYDSSMNLTLTEVSQYLGVTRQYIRKALKNNNMCNEFVDQSIKDNRISHALSERKFQLMHDFENNNFNTRKN